MHTHVLSRGFLVRETYKRTRTAWSANRRFRYQRLQNATIDNNSVVRTRLPGDSEYNSVAKQHCRCKGTASWLSLKL
ncbi:hypothetical protein K491DRAFT_694030 [Lophiostoma macrostomum CBS 122681]|uniref:Uncharacterized protein n=1 Tax=Lophiostoma macrostomum CBS 122681 TaxID=1314788 RepID=A0A6A6T3D1_9PLEO|nr:hypothetical protein K491DRAFT_694030 [Lophiostoma macrostomum CBS 122681]